MFRCSMLARNNVEGGAVKGGDVNAYRALLAACIAYLLLPLLIPYCLPRSPIAFAELLLHSRTSYDFLALLSSALDPWCKCCS